MARRTTFTRRQVLKAAAAAGPAAYAARAAGQAAVCADTTPVAITTADNTGCPIDADIFPPSPFIMNPFAQPLPVPTGLAPGYRNPDGTLAATQAWNVRQLNGVFGNFASAPGFGPGKQDSMGERPMANDGKTFTFVNPRTGALTTKTLNFGGAKRGTHQLYPGGLGTSYANLSGQAKTAFDLLNANPILYHIRLQVRAHSITTSPVVSVNSAGAIVPLPAGAAPTAAGTVKLPQPGDGITWGVPVGTAVPQYVLPGSTIYGFNGTFPGPQINFEYGRPVIVRFENDLDLNPNCLNRNSFGAPDWGFLTHLHNGHTAPESDGQPNHLQDNDGAYQPGQWVDNLYLGYGAGGLDAEKQSTLWFHDHRMHHTGPNVYKGMVGLMPHYDPATAFNPGGIDGGDETTGLRLPGVRVNNPDGSFNVNFDMYLALYDCRMDDGVSAHSDTHQPITPQPWSNNVCGQSHPEWWGQLFLQHYPNHGFVGDIFTVNGVAFPTLTVERRHYRFRFLGASLSRQYRLKLSNTQGGFKLAPYPGTQGQWGFVDNKNVSVVPPQCMRMTQIAAEGGLLPTPLLVDYIDIWPAKRREVVVDFSVYMNGSPTKAGDAIYLTNHFMMSNGRKVDGVDQIAKNGGGSFPTVTPLVKFVIGSGALAADASDPGLSPIPVGTKNQVNKLGIFNPNKVLRPRLSPPAAFFNDVTAPLAMDFTLQRGGAAGGETQWLINGLQFDPINPLWAPTVNTFEHWGINNGGGGWTHPMHIHYEEHQVTYRSTGNGVIPFLQANNADFSNPNHLEDGPRTPIAFAGITMTAGLGKEDVVNLEGSEQTHIYRGFRTFLGNYVAHCHNLAHEDHNMMFGWCVTL